MNYELLEKRFRALGSDHYLAPNAAIIGDVTMYAGATVWFGAVLRGDNMSITVGEQSSLIGIHATILTGAVVGRDCIIGAKSLVTEGIHIPEGYLAFGTPARPQRPLKDAEREMIRASARDYYERGKLYKTMLKQS